MFKGPGSRYTPPEGPEIVLRCNHPALPISLESGASEDGLRWFFDKHEDLDSALFCYLEWLDVMVEKFPLADNEFLLKRWQVLEKIWSERFNLSTHTYPSPDPSSSTHRRIGDKSEASYS